MGARRGSCGRGRVCLLRVGQQAARAAIDDGPRALVEQSRGLLASGVSAADVAAGPTVELTSGNPPFVIVYDDQHHVLASSAQQSGSVPDLPPGVLDDAVARGEDRVTWQPTPSIREAVVASPWQTTRSHGVVVAGTSLTATENRTRQLGLWVWLAWLVAELFWFVAVSRAAVRSMRLTTTA